MRYISLHYGNDIGEEYSNFYTVQPLDAYEPVKFFPLIPNKFPLICCFTAYFGSFLDSIAVAF